MGLEIQTHNPCRTAVVGEKKDFDAGYGGSAHPRKHESHRFVGHRLTLPIVNSCDTSVESWYPLSSLDCESVCSGVFLIRIRRASLKRSDVCADN